MSPEARDFLDSVRHAEDPTPETEARVLSAVRAAVTVSALAGASVGASKVAKALGGWGALGWKGGSVVLCLVAAASVAAPARTELVRAGLPEPRVAKSPSAPVPAAPSVFTRVPPQRPVVLPVNEPRAAPSPPSAERTAGPFSPPSLRDDLALLADVQSALRRGDAASAVERLGARGSGETPMSAELRAARILALCSAGRVSDARAAAAEFRRRYPTSLQRGTIERSCAAEPTRAR